MSKHIFIGNDTVVELDGLRNAAVGTYISDATVSVRVTNRGGMDVEGAAWPLTMAFVAGSNGKYRATLPAAMVLNANTKYVAVVLAASGSLNGRWEIDLYAIRRVA